MEVDGFYAMPSTGISNLGNNRPAVCEKLIDDRFDADRLRIDSDSGQDPEMDFYRRRHDRRKLVYLSPGGVDGYVLIAGNQVVGNSDLFMADGLAKIEDVTISANRQRQGFGSLMLKELSEIAASRDAETVYLLTSEEDTAKEMYKKLGFIKVGEKTQLHFSL